MNLKFFKLKRKSVWWYVDTGAVYNFERIKIGWMVTDAHLIILEFCVFW